MPVVAKYLSCTQTALQLWLIGILYLRSSLQAPNMLPLSQSMRANYASGVDKYYAEHASTNYRNPHYPGIVKTLATLLDIYMQSETERVLSTPLTVLDMAAGSGEATEALLTWSRKRTIRKLHAPQFSITATDPYTAPAYKERTGRECLPLSFSDITQDKLPCEPEVFDIVICSFALHLLTEPSRLWALLTALAPRAKLLVVLAPHKKPAIKQEWGWARLDPWTLEEADDNAAAKDIGGKRGDGYEIYEERVRLRVWRSTML